MSVFLTHGLVFAIIQMIDTYYSLEIDFADKYVFWGVIFITFFVGFMWYIFVEKLFISKILKCVQIR